MNLTFWMILMAAAALIIALLPIMKGRLSRETQLLIALITAVPLSGLIGYKIGSYEKPPAPPIAASQESEAQAVTTAPDPIKMVAQLESRLKGGTGTPDEWLMLARSYVTLNRHNEAVAAYEKATVSITNDAQVYADYADAIAMSKGGLDQTSEALIDKALKVDPMNPKALALKATVAFNNKDYASAIDLWQKMLTVSGLNQDWAGIARGNIEEARSLMRKK